MILPFLPLTKSLNRVFMETQCECNLSMENSWFLEFSMPSVSKILLLHIILLKQKPKIFQKVQKESNERLKLYTTLEIRRFLSELCLLPAPNSCCHFESSKFPFRASQVSFMNVSKREWGANFNIQRHVTLSYHQFGLENPATYTFAVTRFFPQIEICSA